MCSLTTTLHHFYWFVCQFGQSGLNHNCSLVLLVLVTKTTYTSSTLRVGQKLRRKFEGLVYENAENQYPRRTICPKRDPWHTYTQFKKLNGRPWSSCFPDVKPVGPTCCSWRVGLASCHRPIFYFHIHLRLIVKCSFLCFNRHLLVYLGLTDMKLCVIY